MNQQDIADIKTVLNEQFDSIQRLGKMPLSSLENWREYQTIYNDVLECNKVLMEIVCGPVGGIEKLVEKTNDWNYTKPIIGLDENGQPIMYDSWGNND